MPPHILVAEDQADIRDLIALNLRQAGYQVTAVADGAQALAQQAELARDLLVLDLMMPEVTGFDVIEALRADPATRQMPILVVTAKDLTREERELLNASVSEIMHKSGLSRDAFLAEVRGLLRKTAAKM